MTAMTPAYAHAYQTICLGMPSPGVPHFAFPLFRLKSRYSFLPNDRSLSKDLGHDYRGWALFTDGGTRVVQVNPKGARMKGARNGLFFDTIKKTNVFS